MEAESQYLVSSKSPAAVIAGYFNWASPNLNSKYCWVFTHTV